MIFQASPLSIERRLEMQTFKEIMKCTLFILAILASQVEWW